MILLSLLGPLRPVLVLALFCVAAYAEDSARPAGTWHFDEDAEEQLAEIQQRIYDAYRAGNFEGCHAGAKEKWALIRSQLGYETAAASAPFVHPVLPVRVQTAPENQ